MTSKFKSGVVVVLLKDEIFPSVEVTEGDIGVITEMGLHSDNLFYIRLKEGGNGIDLAAFGSDVEVIGEL